MASNDAISDALARLHEGPSTGSWAKGQDMPFTVAVDSTGESVHQTGPREWQSRVGKIPVVVS